jgi:hypothetical protein
MKQTISAWAKCLFVGALLSTAASRAAPGPTLSASYAIVPAGSVVDLTAEGEVDWVHWGLYTETSLDRKASVVPQISDFTPVDAANGFVFVYPFGDNTNGYSWSDGTPTAAVTNTTTGVWAYGTPPIGTGFKLSAPADTATRTLKVYVGAFKARGRFEAYLSDGSGRRYTDTSLSNLSNGPSAVYTLTYAAGSAGQQLIVVWTLAMPDGSDANVTLQAAALTAPGVNNPPFVTLTNPVNNASFPANGDITLEAQARDLDGTVAKVEFIQGDTILGEDTTTPFSYTWHNVPVGHYVLSARATDDQGASSMSSPVEIFVHGTGGSLTGSATLPPSLPQAINLTSEGTRDWIHWGRTNDWMDRKAGVTAQISDFAQLGTNLVERYADNYSAFSWSDGTPTASDAGTTTGVFTHGAEDGFELVAAADTSTRTLRVYVGLYGAQGEFQAWLSDFSAPPYTDTSLQNVGNAYAVYELTYRAASAGQSLIVQYRPLRLLDRNFGNVTLQSATLVAEAPPDTVTILAPTMSGPVFRFSFATQAGHSYAAQFSDGLSNAQWQTFTNLTGAGGDANIADPVAGHPQRFYRVRVP